MTDILQRLEDERQIRAVLHAYCRAMDRNDHELGYSCFHEDGVTDCGAFYQGSGRDYVDYALNLHTEQMLVHTHQITNIMIEVSGDRAVSETYGLVNQVRRSPDDPEQFALWTLHGRYVDKWSRRDGRWAIDKRRLQLDFRYVQPIDVQMGWSSRDRNDASYEILGSLG